MAISCTTCPQAQNIHINYVTSLNPDGMAWACLCAWKLLVTYRVPVVLTMLKTSSSSNTICLVRLSMAQGLNHCMSLTLKFPLDKMVSIFAWVSEEFIMYLHCFTYLLFRITPRNKWFVLFQSTYPMYCTVNTISRITL